MTEGIRDGRKRAQTGLKNAICPGRTFRQNPNKAALEHYLQQIQALLTEAGNKMCK